LRLRIQFVGDLQAAKKVAFGRVKESVMSM
jgi:hypothetical protein